MKILPMGGIFQKLALLYTRTCAISKLKNFKLVPRIVISRFRSHTIPHDTSFGTSNTYSDDLVAFDTKYFSRSSMEHSNNY